MPLFLTLESGFLVSAIAFVLDAFQVCLIARLIGHTLFPKSTHPLITLLEFITDPMLKKVRQFVPPLGKIDMSGVFLFIAAEFIKLLLGAATMFI
jgi:uncharacterized protein YggT (Ycf19 family)